MVASLVASFSLSKMMAWPFEIAAILFVAGCAASYFLVYARPRRHGKQQRRYRPDNVVALNSKSKQFALLPTLSLIAIVTAFIITALFFWHKKESQPQSIAANTSEEFSCEVSAVHDGDTLYCSDGRRIRLHAIAARELDENCGVGHPCPSVSGAAAKAALVELADGQTLKCRATGTSYERIAAICRNEADIEVNCAMVERGVALRWDKFHLKAPICGAI